MKTLISTIVLLACSFTFAAAPRPNIIVIVCDDMGFSDVGCFGGEVNTPNLDRLATQGVRLTQFYNNAKCTETRASLLSGLYYQQSNNLRQRNAVTIPEVLRTAGYTTLMSGKWHLGSWASGNPKHWDEADLPIRRGFDRYFGHLGGAINFFTGEDWASGRNLMRLGAAEYNVPDDFYSTDAMTDYALQFVDEAVTQRDERGDRKPFFMYLAYNAPHFPLQAPAEDIAKYRGRYRIGWDEIRRQRDQRMRQMGITREGVPLSPRDAIVPAWDTLDAERRDDEDLLMAVYAAMIDRMDQNIGRLMAKLDAAGVAEDTLVIFFSDNGACPYKANRTPDLPPGPAASLRSYDSEWANASNTPLTLYKQWAHEGGVSTPCIVRWPRGIDASRRGSIHRGVSHIIDLMPTCVELAGATYPTEFNGQRIEPMEGESMLPLLRDEAGAEGKPRTLFWEFRGHHAVRDGDYKLVAESGVEWSLYHIPTDRSETNDLAKQRPELVERLEKLYDAWAQRVGAKTHKQCIEHGLVKQGR